MMRKRMLNKIDDPEPWNAKKMRQEDSDLLKNPQKKMMKQDVLLLQGKSSNHFYM